MALLWLILKLYNRLEDFFLLDSVRYRDDVPWRYQSPIGPIWRFWCQVDIANWHRHVFHLQYISNVMAILRATSLRHCYNIIMSPGYMWSSYLILCFYYLITDFISNWKCSMKEAASWREPHSWQLQTLGSLVFNSPHTQDVNWTYIRRPEDDVLDVFWTSYVRSIYVLCLQGWVGEKRAQNFCIFSISCKTLSSSTSKIFLQTLSCQKTKA